jgi:hypothetical protein
VRPDYYCTDASFETIASVIAITNILENLQVYPDLWALYYSVLPPYTYKIIIGMANLILYCNETEPVNIKGNKTSIGATIFDT